MANAIVIVENESVPRGSAPKGTQREALASVDVLGISVVHRTVDRLIRDGVQNIAVYNSSLAETETLEERPNVVVTPVTAPWEAAARELARCKSAGVDTVLIMRVGAYMEFDLADAFRFHAEHAECVVRAFDDGGPLDLWILQPARIPESEDMLAELRSDKSTYYPLRGYVNRLENPRDLRQLVVDSFNSRCRLRPQGFEVRQGVWMGEGAQVERGARIVSPAFIGRDVTISEQCLVTRCSNVERDSHVDYGTVVEDTSILPNSYVGIGLDLAHSIVDGSTLMNLHHGVMLKIGDPAVMRQNKRLPGVDRNLWTSSRVAPAIPAMREQGAK